MKIVTVGGGRLSIAFNKHLAQLGIHNAVIPLSDLTCGYFEFGDLIAEIKDSDAVLFLGYDYNSLIDNILILNKLLSALFDSKWRGLFIFFNSQLTLPGIFTIPTVRLNKTKHSFLTDKYAITKRLQASVLGFHARKGCFSTLNLYLPVVIGENMKANDRYTYIASHKSIVLPSCGKNTFAVCDISALCFYITNVLHEYDTSRFSITQIPRIRKAFLYTRLASHAELITNLSVAGASESNCVIKESNRNIYAPAFYSNLKYRITRTFVWGLINLIKSEMIAVVRPKPYKYGLAMSPETNKDGIFEPIGFEREFMSSTIDLAQSDVELIDISYGA